MAGATLTSWRLESVRNTSVALGAEPSARSGPHDVPGGGGGGGVTDRRRKVDRELAERLVERARLLPAAEQGLVRAVFEDDRRATELAALVGQTPRTVRRRTQRLVQRLLSPRYMFVARHMTSWPGTRRKVAAAIFLEGLPVRRAAQRLGKSLYVVRRHRDAIQAMFEQTGR